MIAGTLLIAKPFHLTRGVFDTNVVVPLEISKYKNNTCLQKHVVAMVIHKCKQQLHIIHVENSLDTSLKAYYISHVSQAFFGGWYETETMTLVEVTYV